jgi:glycosyltransferase involved in cell wall biosynthesis
LAGRYRASGASNVRVIENHLERGMFGFGSRSRHRGLVVGWVAGREHAPDLELVPVVDALRRLLDMHRDLRVLSVGLALPLRSERYEHVEEVAFRDLLKVSGRIDIGIAPLADTPFNRCRSNVKLKEYASGGAPWLASPVGPYRGLGEQQGGLLVNDDGWVRAIDGLIRGRRARKRLAGQALRWAKTQTIDHHAGQWEQAFEDAIERSRAASRRRVPRASPLG